MKFTVVGGGTAGWMTAATLNKAYPDSTIIVYESPDTPATGVGESTTQFFRYWLNYIGLQDEDWMKKCDATYKVSVRFHNFHQKGDDPWQYPFGTPREDIYPPDYWFWYQYKKGWKNSKFAPDYCISAKCSDENKLPVGKYAEKYFPLKKFSGFHFNAVKFANFLRDEVCLPAGVIHKIETLEGKPDNNSDLYFDCTGFKSLLNKSPWKSFQDWLPNNSAIVTRVHYDDKNEQIKPVTDCTALSSGWVWNVPTWDTIGTGYVYCDKFLTKKQAIKEFRDYLADNVQSDAGLYTDKMFRQIKFKTGRREEIWKDDVVSIGLSAGFVEPLESNGLLSIHNFLLYFIRVMQNRTNVTQFMRDTFNNHCNYKFDGFASFVACHYAMTQRDDTEYWRYVSKIRYPYNNLLSSTEINYMEESANFGDKYSWNNLASEALFYIMSGHGWNPFNDVVESEMNFLDAHVDEYDEVGWDQSEIDKMPSPYQYYQDTIYAS